MGHQLSGKGAAKKKAAELRQRLVADKAQQEQVATRVAWEVTNHNHIERVERLLEWDALTPAARSYWAETLAWLQRDAGRTLTPHRRQRLRRIECARRHAEAGDPPLPPTSGQRRRPWRRPESRRAKFPAWLRGDEKPPLPPKPGSDES